ncbi:hypothetical protein ACFTUC_40805, partial [Streptomyces sp. NPDC056944]|uniref:hypothetical protein n=1 Tax=Streptomyces sp. NPDC056944 TaxID=3345972 RepID=UPI0036358BEF
MSRGAHGSAHGRALGAHGSAHGRRGGLAGFGRLAVPLGFLDGLAGGPLTVEAELLISPEPVLALLLLPLLVGLGLPYGLALGPLTLLTLALHPGLVVALFAGELGGVLTLALTVVPLLLTAALISEPGALTLGLLGVAYGLPLGPLTVLALTALTCHALTLGGA